VTFCGVLLKGFIETVSIAGVYIYVCICVFVCVCVCVYICVYMCLDIYFFMKNIVVESLNVCRTYTNLLLVFAFMIPRAYRHFST